MSRLCRHADCKRLGTLGGRGRSGTGPYTGGGTRPEEVDRERGLGAEGWGRHRTQGTACRLTMNGRWMQGAVGLARCQGWLLCGFMVGCCWVPAGDAGMAEGEEGGRGGDAALASEWMRTAEDWLGRLGCCGTLVRRGVLRLADCERVGVSTGRGRLETGPYRRTVGTRGDDGGIGSESETPPPRRGAPTRTVTP